MIEEIKVITAELVYPLCKAFDLSSEECNELTDKIYNSAKAMTTALIIMIWWNIMSMKIRKTKAFESLMDYLRGLVELRYA
jgi:hypothetical protein